MVGIIAKNAQIGYLPDAFSPAALYRDPTFADSYGLDGGFLFYLTAIPGT